MPNKFITVPESVSLRDLKTNEPLESEGISFQTIVEILLNHTMFNESYDNIRSANTIYDVCVKNSKEPGDIISIPEEDLKKLQSAIKAPKIIVNGNIVNGFPYVPSVMRQLQPLLDAIMSATDK